MSQVYALNQAESPFTGRHVLMIVAHPDDEVLGAGGQFSTVGRLSLIHLTDGAPSNRSARQHGCPSRRAYAELREKELTAALKGVRASRFRLHIPDQHVTFHLVAASMQVTKLIELLQPDFVLTHPYEGGHPDHDAAAFITAAAIRLLGRAVPLWEFASYHAGPSGMVAGRFLAGHGTCEIAIELDQAALARKHRALACFHSQRDIVASFPVETERFRQAPRYDFGRPPHAGRLLYEGRTRAWTGRHWRRHAKAAERRLNAGPVESLRSGPDKRLYQWARELVWRAWLAI